MDRIGEYLLRRLVGEGGMGKVYEAEERLSRRRVALKVLRRELAQSAQGRELFLNEMTILAHLDHPNIVRCLSCAEVDGELVMALELLEGQTLRERLIESSMSWQQAVDVTVQVAAALRAAHGQQPPIIHRDLKPENLMLLPEGRVKVMDFGIAKVLAAIGRSTTHSIGTLQYMSPEQIDAAGVDERSDIYCLGLVLYEMLAGHPPFESESPRELLNMQCTDEPPALPDTVRARVPKGVEHILFQMLRKAPAERPATADDVLAALDPFAAAVPGPGASESRPTPSGDGPQQAAIATGRATAERASASAPAAATGDQAETGSAAGAPRAARQDTIALIERAAAPRQVPTQLAIAIALALCVLAGVVTYVLRVNTADAAPAAAAERSQPTAER